MSITSSGRMQPTAGPQAPDVRRWIRELRASRRTKTVGDLLYQLYLGLIIVGIPVIYIIVQALTASPVSPSAARALMLDLGTWMPAGLLIALLGMVRLGVWRGPVALGDADLTWLLSAPLPRAAQTRPVLVRSVIVTAAAGAIAGTVLWVALVAHLAVSPPVVLAACAGCGALIATLGTAGAWAVERRPDVARAVLRGSPVIGLAAVGLLLLDGGGPMAVVVRWSGPWGWATLVVLGAIGQPSTGWPVALMMLVVTAAAGTVWMVRTAGAVSMEQLRHQAGTSRAVAAGVFWLQPGAITAARRAAVIALLGRRIRRLPPPPTRGLAIPWAGMSVLVRAPWLLGRVVATAAVAGLAGRAGAAAGGGEAGAGIVWLVLALLAGYSAAAALVEPLRVEVTQRFGIRHLIRSEPAILLTHLVAPGIVLALALALAAGTASVLGGAGAAIAWSLAGASAALAPGLVLGAAYGALREPPDTTMLLYGEMGAMIWAAQIASPVQWAIFATLPAAAVATELAAGGQTTVAVLVGGGLAVISAGAGSLLLRRWLRLHG